MHEPDMITAFDECVERILAGEPVERVLQDYPTLAGVLRPMLEVTLGVRRSAPTVPVAAKARVGARVLQAADRLGYVRQPRPALPRLTWAAAVLVVVLFAGLLSVWLRREPENAGAPSPTWGVTVTAIGTPDVTLSATASLTATPTPTASPTVALCEFVVTVTSANLRSGPGTGYAVIGTAPQGERLRVLAQDASGTWYEVVRVDPPLEAWISASVGTLEGACTDLPVSDLPLLSGSGGDSGSSGSGEHGNDAGSGHMPGPETPDMGGMFEGGHGGGFEDYMPHH